MNIEFLLAAIAVLFCVVAFITLRTVDSISFRLRCERIQQCDTLDELSQLRIEFRDALNATEFGRLECFFALQRNFLVLNSKPYFLTMKRRPDVFTTEQPKI